MRFGIKMILLLPSVAVGKCNDIIFFFLSIMYREIKLLAFIDNSVNVVEKMEVGCDLVVK